MQLRGRLKGAFQALAYGAVPGIDYMGLYRARVLKQHASLNRVDVQPEDPRLPPMANIPLRVGAPGDRYKLATHPGGQPRVPLYVLVGWERPDLPFATLWESANKVLPGQAVAVAERAIEAEHVSLGAAELNKVSDGVVHGSGTDPYTGLPYWMLGVTSKVVGAKK